MRNAARLPNAFNVRLALEGVSGILNQPLIHEGSAAITKAQPRTRVNRRTRYSKWYSMKISNLRVLIFNIRIVFHFSFPRRSRDMACALRSTTSDKLLTLQHKEFSPQIRAPTSALIA